MPYAWCRPAILPGSLTALYRPRLTTSLLIPHKRGCQTKFKTSGETEILDKLLFSIKMFYTLHVCVHAHSLQLCPTFCDPVDYSLPGSSVHGDSPGKNTGVGCHALLQGIFPIQGRSTSLSLLALGGGFFATRRHLGIIHSLKSICCIPGSNFTRCPAFLFAKLDRLNGHHLRLLPWLMNSITAQERGRTCH